MLRARASLLTALLGLTHLLAAPGPALATWKANGNPVCRAPGNQSSQAAISDGSGGIFVTWFDQRPGAPGVYAQRMLADGSIAPGWPEDGVLCSGTTAAGAPTPVPDGTGGALILWVAGPIYAQRIDADGGMHAGWPTNGKLITSDLSVAGNAQYVSFVPDGAGGAYFTRVTFNPSSFSHTLRLTRIGSDGSFAPGWSEAGVAVAGGYYVTLFRMEADPTGGVVLALWSRTDDWVDFQFGFVKRVGANGAISYQADATSHCSGGAPVPEGVTWVSAAPDGNGGAYAMWFDQSDSGPCYFAQHFSAAGQPLWPVPTSMPFADPPIQDGTSGVWYVRSPSSGIEVHRRLTDGQLPPGWTPGGVHVADFVTLGGIATGTFPTVVVICWSADTGSGHDIRALSVRQDGVIPPGWDPGGTLFCDAPGNQMWPVLVLEGAGALACWQDFRPGATSPDLYANRIQPSNPVGVEPEVVTRFALIGVRPNPALERATVEFTLPDAAPATIEMLDLTGRRIARIAGAERAGRQSVPLGLEGIRPGVYWVRLVQGPSSATTRFAVVR
jgi:hypothetical protein